MNRRNRPIIWKIPMRFVRLTSAAALLLAAPAAAQQAAPVITQQVAPLPDWLAGIWMMEDGSSWSEEIWSGARGDMMLGVAKSGFGPKLENWESTKIIRKPDGKISFFAQPKGAPPSEFPLTVTSEQAVEFANPAHDYPQRIRYWRQGQLLMAEISKIDGSKAMRWNYRPVVSPPDR